MVVPMASSKGRKESKGGHPDNQTPRHHLLIPLRMHAHLSCLQGAAATPSAFEAAGGAPVDGVTAC